MKSWKIWVFALLLTACAGKPNADSSSGKASVKEVTDSLAPSLNSQEDLPPSSETRTLKNNIPEAWKKDFTWFNEGEPLGKLLIGNTYELMLTEESPKLFIFSESMGSPHGKLKISANGSPEALSIFYLDYISGSGWDEFSEGDKLFTLRKEGDEILTEWEALKPLYGEVPDKGKYFEEM